MKSTRSKNYEYESMTPSRGKTSADGGYSTLRPSHGIMGANKTDVVESRRAIQRDKAEKRPSNPPKKEERPTQPETKAGKKVEADTKRLGNDRWLKRNGHLLTYVGLFLFSFMVLFRPYEIIPGIEFMASTTIYFALLTLAVYVPSQISTEGNLTMLSTEVKAVLAMTAISLVTMPIARDPVAAWTIFNEPYIKAVVIFIVMVNVVRTRKRLMGLMSLSLGIGVYLSIATVRLWSEGKFSIEGYRVGLTEVKGIFGNPNEMAMHFVMMTPLVITLGLASKSWVMRLVYFGMAVLFVVANVLTYSRGAFLGLIACSAVLIWKLGRRQRLNVSVISIVIGGLGILLAPGNYGLRLLSIFVPSLDPVGSADQRREQLITSVMVTLRNPWGIGIGNSFVFGMHNLETHNAYTQVSSELGLLGLAAYLILMISPFRKLGAIERTLFAKSETGWFYYMAIGLQASIVGYMVSSFFASVAYNWFIYYLIAYAIAFRRIYSVENGLNTEAEEPKRHLRAAMST